MNDMHTLVQNLRRAEQLGIMTPTGHESFRGVTVDHLYAGCPACPKPAIRQQGWVDPNGTDICGLCLKRWRNK